MTADGPLIVISAAFSAFKSLFIVLVSLCHVMPTFKPQAFYNVMRP